MTEVQLLQALGLCVLGLGGALLLFVKARFVRVVAFVAIVLGAFTLVSLSIPQMASLPPAVEKFDVASIKEKKDLAGIGQKIFFGKEKFKLHELSKLENSIAVAELMRSGMVLMSARSLMSRADSNSKRSK